MGSVLGSFLGTLAGTALDPVVLAALPFFVALGWKQFSLWAALGLAALLITILSINGFDFWRQVSGDPWQTVLSVGFHATVISLLAFGLGRGAAVLKRKPRQAS